MFSALKDLPMGWNEGTVAVCHGTYFGMVAVLVYCYEGSQGLFGSVSPAIEL